MDLQYNRKHTRITTGPKFPASVLVVAVILIICPGRIQARNSPADRAVLHNISGMKCLHEGKYARAETCFLQAISLDPRVKYYYNNLSVAYIRSGEYEKALRTLKTCTGIDPGYTKALANMATASFYLYRFYDAYRYYREALAADRDYTEKRFKREKVLVRIKNISEKNPDNRELKRIIRHMENTRKITIKQDSK